MFSGRTLARSAKVSCRNLQIAEPRALNLKKDALAKPWNVGSFRVCPKNTTERLAMDRDSRRFLRLVARLLLSNSFQECPEYGGTWCTGPTWTKLVPIWPSWTYLAKLVVILLCVAFLEKAPLTSLDQVGPVLFPAVFRALLIFLVFVLREVPTISEEIPTNLQSLALKTSSGFFSECRKGWHNRKVGLPQGYIRARASSATLCSVHDLRAFLCIFYISKRSVEPKVRLQGYGYNPFCSHSSRCLAVLV